MFYSITIKLPKSKIKKYDMPAPISVNDLSNDEFVNLLSGKPSHRQLARDLNKLKNGLVDVRWETLSPEKANLLTGFYSNNPLFFADVNTIPGDNNTLSQKEGMYRVEDIPKNINLNNRAYITLGVNPIPFFRVNNKNYFVPNYEINPLYLVKFEKKPNAQTFEFILNKLKEERVLEFPLSEPRYDKKPDFYQIGDVYYLLPDYATVAKDASLMEVFNKFKNKQIVYEFITNLDAWREFLGTLPKTTNADNYGPYLDLNYPKVKSSLNGTTNQDVSVYMYQNQIPYYIPRYKTLSKTPELFELFNEIVVENRPIKNSLANQVLKELKLDGTFNEIINDGLIFDTEYVCSRDPRWTEFINEEILKGRDKDSLLYFFSSIKEISPSYSDIDDRMSYHIFNLSNTYVEKIPDGPWKAGIKSGKIHEFTIFCIANEIQKTDGFNLCSQYKCISRTPNSKGEIKENVFLFNTENTILENRYSFDAVLKDSSGRVQYILEYDGTDHYFPRTYKDQETGEIKVSNPTNKIISDQVKNNFARHLEIPCIRIPGFSKNKSTNFTADFKTFVTNLIRQRYNLPTIEQTPENVNPGIYTKAAYTIRKIIK